MLPRERPLPYACRPFPEEPLGGWLGRISGYYHMGIDELAAEFDVDFGLDEECRDWLSLPSQPEINLERIGYLTHSSPKDLRALEVNERWGRAAGAYRFCRTCLFVNPENVFAPRWIREWLNPEYGTCPKHGEMELLDSSDLVIHRNFTALLHLVSSDSPKCRSRVRRRRRARAGW